MPAQQNTTAAVTESHVNYMRKLLREGAILCPALLIVFIIHKYDKQEDPGGRKLSAYLWRCEVILNLNNFYHMMLCISAVFAVVQCLFRWCIVAPCGLWGCKN